MVLGQFPNSRPHCAVMGARKCGEKVVIGTNPRPPESRGGGARARGREHVDRCAQGLGFVDKSRKWRRKEWQSQTRAVTGQQVEGDVWVGHFFYTSLKTN